MASLNCPEENDETSGEWECDESVAFPSWAAPQASPHSLPSLLPSAVCHTLSHASSRPSGPRSLPGPSGLESPRSLHSFAPDAHLHCPGSCLHPLYGPQLHPPPPQARLTQHLSSRDAAFLQYRHVDAHFSENGHGSVNSRQANQSVTHLPQEQRKVFVTYEADSEDHLKEIIKFVAFLRNNGFDTHIDVFEQQLNSISKIDCMERYLNEKDYLIIIIISLRYYETISGQNLDIDERTSNTVYIHKQLQTEFIQNGCRNYRFIPILFPGAQKCFVPAWLQNTHVYVWPKERDDVLRRLLRVEKYSPPPVGPLPTIVSIPL